MVHRFLFSNRFQSQQLTEYIYFYYMAESFQFGGRNPGGSTDKLQHYRIEIRKLKEMNQMMGQKYEAKIAHLQQQLRSGARSNKDPFIDPTSTLNRELIKRDKEINRLAEENQRLKKENNKNPDRELLKKRDMFESLADKDQQIMKLKKIIHELENRYDGRYFNENKLKKQYELLFQENEKLRREIESFSRKQQKNHEISPQIYDLIRYKKRNEVLERENEHLQKQIQKVSTISNPRASKQLGQNTKYEALIKQLKDSNKKNRELFDKVDELERENNILYQENKQLRKYKGGMSESEIQPFRVQKQTYEIRRPLVDRESVSSSKHSKQLQEDSSIRQQSRVRETEVKMMRETMIQPKKSEKQTIRKTGLYDEFNLGEVIKNVK